MDDKFFKIPTKTFPAIQKKIHGQNFGNQYQFIQKWLAQLSLSTPSRSVAILS